MSRKRSSDSEQRSSQDDGATRSKKGKKRPKDRLVLLIFLAIIACVVIVAVVYASSYSPGLKISQGDKLQYAIQGYESNANVSGSLILEVTSVSSNSFTATYAITLNNNTNRTEVTFSGASGDWSSNAGNVVSKLSGSSASATQANTTTYSTIGGERNLTGYVISTTTQSGIPIYFEYWLDTTTNCPYVMALTYGNGDTLTFNLVNTNISEFT